MRDVMTGIGFLLLVSVLVTVPFVPTAVSERAPFDETEALRRSQAALGRTIGDFAFVTADHRHVRLSEYRGKPLVMSLVYTSCADICPTVSEDLADAVRVGQDALGRDSFRDVSLGFDWRHDTPKRMKAFARSRGLDADNWEFLSADGDTVDRLAEDLGFTYAVAPQGFNHIAQTTVLDADGRVFRQIYGATLDPPQLVEPLKRLVFARDADAGTWTRIANNVRLFCTIYDPASGRYRFDYSMFAMMGGGLLSLGSIAVVLVIGWRRRYRTDQA